MSHEEVCPLCKGTGQYFSEGAVTDQKCHGCDGKGWITVGIEYPRFVRRDGSGTQNLGEPQEELK